MLNKFRFAIDDLISRVRNFAQSMFETKLSVNDYTFVFLGQYPKNSKAIMFNAPGAIHHVR